MSMNDLNLYERKELYVNLYKKKKRESISKRNLMLLKFLWKQRITYLTNEILR